MAACSSCGRDNPEGFSFCGACGSPLGTVAAPTEVRKTVTVVFCDLTGSTELGERLDPERLRRVVTRFFEEMRAVLERHGGTVEKFIGDAVMAIFGVPTVHEDDALRAVRAAVEMRERMASLNEELRGERGVALEARIGVNTGEVVVGAGDPSAGTNVATGDAVNVAARLQTAADPGQVLIGEATFRLVRDAVRVDAIEPIPLKGKAEPVPAYALVEVERDALGVARHLDAPLVGRDVELEALRGALARSARERAPVLATVIGVPGVGKSRLVEEFAVQHAAEALVVHGRCLSYGDGITYWPVVEILTSVAGIAEDDSPRDVRRKLAGALDGTPDAGIVVERLAEFLGLAGAVAKPEETHWAVRKLFEALARDRALVVVFEDLHWAEPALLDLLEHLVAWTRDAPILLVATARPDLLEERADWAAATPSAVTLGLEPLKPDASEELVANLLGSTEVPDGVRSMLETAEGNPLFLEQLVGMLIDEGHLRRVGDRWSVVGDLASVQVPSTIAGILESRLERLSTSERDVLERGSIEGREFHWASVTELSPGVDPRDVGRHLLALVRRGLIDPAPARFGGGDAFSFRHALVRDAAYARLSKTRRADLHERHARWVERIAGDRLAELEDVLAYHLEQAVRFRSELGPLDAAARELAAEAAERLHSSGKRAASRGDMQAAASLLDRAARLLDPDDPVRAEVLVRLGEVLIETGDAEAAMRSLEEGRELASRHGDTRIEVRARMGEALRRLHSDPEGVTDEFRRLAEELPVLEAAGDDDGMARVWKGLGEQALMDGDPREMTEAYERAALHAERAGDRALLADALGWLALIVWWDLTPPADAIAKARALRERLPDDRHVEAMTASSQGLSLGMLGRFDEGRRLYDHGLEIFEELGLHHRAAGMRDGRSRIETLAGDVDAAGRELQAGYDALASMGEKGYLSTQAAMLADVRYRQGRLDEAEELTRISEEAAASDDLVSQIQWRSVRAKVSARRGAHDAAIELGEEAVAIASRTSMWDLRSESLRDLAEVYRLAGRTEAAADALRRALSLVEEKGVVPLLDPLRAELAELGS